MAETELKPCPFCGGAALLMQRPEGDYAQCGGCLAKTPRYYESAVAISAWNRRSPDPIREEMARALEALARPDGFQSDIPEKEARMRFARAALSKHRDGQ